MEKLTQADIKILETEIKTKKLFQLVLLGLTAVAIIVLSLSQYLHWEFPASFFAGFFGSALAIISLIHYFMIRNTVRDLSNGVKTWTEGVIIKKEMKTGYNTYNTDYPQESLVKLAQYVEGKEKGVIKDDGINSLARDAKSSFLITLGDKSDYAVRVRDYVDLHIGDNVRMEFTPVSKTFLKATKL
jgi:hypothetical protein